MRNVTGILLLALVAGVSSLDARKPQRETDVDVSVVFSSRDVRAIHDYYRDDRRSLPPGLQKKLARGGTLPPGWQKKIAPLPRELEGRMAPLRCEYCRRGVIEGHVVIYNRRTMAVLDVMSILGR